LKAALTEQNSSIRSNIFDNCLQRKYFFFPYSRVPQFAFHHPSANDAIAHEGHENINLVRCAHSKNRFVNFSAAALTAKVLGDRYLVITPVNTFAAHQ